MLVNYWWDPAQPGFGSPWDALMAAVRRSASATAWRMVARTAAHYGAVVRTSTQVVALLREGDRVTGVRVRDSENGAVTEVQLRVEHLEDLGPFGHDVGLVARDDAHIRPSFEQRIGGGEATAVALELL